MLFLSILKIIGFVLLGILAFILLLLLIILFWPFFYRIEADYHGKLKAKAGVSYLFHLIRANFIYEDGKPLLVAKVLFFTVYKNDFSDSGKEDEAEEPEDDFLPGEDEAIDSLDEKLSKEDGAVEGEEAKAFDEDFDDDLTDEEIEEFMNSDLPKKKRRRRKKGFFRELKSNIQKIIQKCKEKWYSIKERYQTTKEKIEYFHKRVQYYYKVLHHKSMKPALDMVKKTLKGLLNHIKPYYLRANIYYGADDPADTAKAVIAYSSIYPFFKKQIRFKANFQEKVFEADFLAKGRIVVFRILFLVIRAYLNKHIHKMIKLLTREGKKNGRKQV